ncbi:hypothetical protein FB45DRAFT_1080687 [Roridomyces roridus]|uniref:DUF6924 domain-containing protein n=1 Tax=Roridomyces roridus TaxID=1738132 RepID=A0AAD7BSM5_9AGAR|nr:hypothetical protein FB45DRAFT_1080687 [Roridomyces roridus]
MASRWPVLITAKSVPLKVLQVPVKTLNSGTTPKTADGSCFTPKPCHPPRLQPSTTKLPITEFPPNDFACSNSTLESLAQINTFIRANEAALEALDISPYTWLVIDENGFATATWLVCERFYDPTEDEEGNPIGHTDVFRACRAPFEKTWGMTANLDIANMGFEDYVDEETGEDEDGVWTWSFPGGVEQRDERDKALKELRDGGYMD